MEPQKTRRTDTDEYDTQLDCYLRMSGYPDTVPAKEAFQKTQIQIAQGWPEPTWYKLVAFGVSKNKMQIKRDF